MDIATYIWWLTDCNQCKGQPLVSWNAFAKGYGDSIERLITPSTPTLIKINQLRSLAFLYRHIALNEEILEYVQRQTSVLMQRLEPTNSKEQLIVSLWGH
nr:hypothetical protein [Pseudomonas vancouverensis]